MIRQTVVTALTGLDQEFAIIQQSLEKPPFPGMSATEGLNLNITVPQGTKSTDRLPVVVFIHGGAFVFGNNYQPHYDFEKLVTLSVEIGKPIIGITIKYVSLGSLWQAASVLSQPVKGETKESEVVNR